jgi:dethiobiotin synthase
VIIFVTGTGTEVGKTWWTAAIASALARRGIAVAARKPVQSFAPGDDDTDAHVLAAATGDEPHAVCPPHRWFARAMAPPMAATALGAPCFTIGDLVTETVWPPDIAVGFVEGAGGARSPLADDGDTTDLIRALAPDDVLVVADAGLGTVNAVRLTVAAIGHVSVVIALNRYASHDLHRANCDWLTTRDGFTVVTDPAELVARWA